jgi:thymidylate synthase (FAD)
MTKQELILNDPNYTPIHEFGFVGFLDFMGSDEEIAAAARVSYGVNLAAKTNNDNRNLLRYMMRGGHTSPFEMAEVKFHLKLPILVMRQLIRHRTANVNEYSGRYSEMSDEFYVPADDYMAPQSKTNKQGREGTISDNDKKTVRDLIEETNEICYANYQTLLGEEITNPAYVRCEMFDDDYPGLSRELARGVLPVSNYTECYWKIDLHNFFHFCGLRLDSHAQREIRDFAQAMYDFAKPHFPLSMEAFEDYYLYAKKLSRMDIIAIMDMLNGSFVADAEYYGMGKREYTEFVDFFRPNATHSFRLLRTED